MIDTASRARLVFANATMLPNWIISGSFWNCGAPPDSVITVAIVSALTTVAASVAAKAATQSTARAAAPATRPQWKTVSVDDGDRARSSRG